MEPFLGTDFLLGSEAAKTLYHQHAAKMPIVDYHCHISPQEIYENKRFRDLAEAWLGGDHYKWRLMRACGIEERLVSGDAPGFEKFKAFAAAVQQSAGNPVYHWAHLELQRYFGITTPLSPATAAEIWESCNRRLQEDETLRVRGIIERSNVTTIVTTDDPVDTLEWHEKLREDKSFTIRVLPAFRPDKAVNIEKGGFVEYIAALSAAAGTKVASYATLQEALRSRMAYFAAAGCRASDHGVQRIDPCPVSDRELDAILQKRLRGEAITREEQRKYTYGILRFLGSEYAKLGWVMELHFGVMRDTNTPMYSRLGPDTGFDCIHPSGGMKGIAALLDDLHSAGELPKTLLFSIDPVDNARLNTLAGCFQEAGVRGKVQQGSAWWFNDSIAGMREQMQCLASTGPLAVFVGMLTDSRSFLSYTRHEYFRRILCDMVGGWVEKGEYPADYAYLGRMIEDISYNNAIEYFGY